MKEGRIRFGGDGDDGGGGGIESNIIVDFMFF